MEKTSKLTEEQLNQVPKDVLVTMYLQLSDTMKQVAEQNNQLLRQVTSLEEKISILTQRHLGRKTEKASEIDQPMRRRSNRILLSPYANGRSEQENAGRICSIWKR